MIADKSICWELIFLPVGQEDFSLMAVISYGNFVVSTSLEMITIFTNVSLYMYV